MESLEDHLLIEIFNYLSLQDLYEGFYHLNYRLNTLLQSLNTLQLTLFEGEQYSHLQPFFPRLHTLILIGQIDLSLCSFPSLHRLILRSPSSTFFSQFNDPILHHLEYLSICNTFFNLSSVHEQIFSNRYPHLHTCHLSTFETIESIHPWTSSPCLHELQIGFIDFQVYKSLLSSCPSLHSLKFQLFQSYLQLSSFPIHRHLKRLHIQSDLTDWNVNDQFIDRFLSGVPSIEELTIERCLPNDLLIDLLPDYHWLAMIIRKRLSRLYSFTFHLHVEYHIHRCETITNDIRRELRRSFLNAHQQCYRTRFHLHLE